MKVYIEIPDGWIDAESPILWVSTTIRDEARRLIKDALVEQCVSHLGDLPAITIPEDELRQAVKERIVDQLASQALERR